MVTFANSVTVAFFDWLEKSGRNLDQSADMLNVFRAGAEAGRKWECEAIIEELRSGRLGVSVRARGGISRAWVAIGSAG